MIWPDKLTTSPVFFDVTTLYLYCVPRYQRAVFLTMAWLVVVAWCVLPVNLCWVLPFGAPIPRSVFLWDFLEGSKKKQIMMWCGWCGWRRRVVVVLYETGCCSFMKNMAFFFMQKMCHNFWGVLQFQIDMKVQLLSWRVFISESHDSQYLAGGFKSFLISLPVELIHLDWYCSKGLKPPTSSPFKTYSPQQYMIYVDECWSPMEKQILVSYAIRWAPMVLINGGTRGPYGPYKSIGKKRPP